MTIKNGLIYPRVRVFMQDGAEWEVQPIGPDGLAYDMHAAKRKWPPMQQIAPTYATFLAWHASKREGLIPPEMTWDRFAAEHQSVIDVDAKDPAAADDLADDDDAGDAAPFPAG